MKTHRFDWKCSIFFAGVVFGMTTFARCGEESDSPGADVSHATNQVTARSEHVAVTGHNAPIERLLEDLPAPRQIIWDRRPLELILLATAKKSNQILGPIDSASEKRNAEVYLSEMTRLNCLVDINRTTVDDHFMLGLLHYDLGHWKLAAENFASAIRLSAKPTDHFYCMRGLAQFQLNDYRAAWNDLNEAVRLSANFLSANVRNLNNRGIIAAASGQFELALKDFDASLAIRQFVVNLSPTIINRALVLSDLGKYDEALTILKNVIETGSGDFRTVETCNLAMGYVYRRSGYFAKSIISYSLVIEEMQADEATRNDQSKRNEQSNYGQIPTFPCKHTSLEESYNKATMVNALVGRGIAHHELKQLTEAISDYNNAILRFPNSTQTYVNRAVAFCENGNFDLAERDLELALKLNPNDAFAWGNRALLKIRQGSMSLSQADFERCLELRPDLQSVIDLLKWRGQFSQTFSPATLPTSEPVQNKRPFPWTNTDESNLRPSPWDKPATEKSRISP